MKLLFPNAQRLNRGNYVIKDLVNACRSNDVTDLIMLHEHRGEPGVCGRTSRVSLSLSLESMGMISKTY